VQNVHVRYEDKYSIKGWYFYYKNENSLINFQL